MDDGEYEDILEDMREECKKFGISNTPLSYIMFSVCVSLCETINSITLF